MHHDIDTKLKWPQKYRCSKRRVDANDKVVFFANRYHGMKISDLQQWIGWSLKPQHFGLRSDRVTNSFGLSRIDIGEVDAIANQDVVEMTGYSTVNIISSNNMIAGTDQF